MKVTELRLGNWVCVQGGTKPVQVKGMDYSGVKYRDGEEFGWCGEDLIQPIPLDEESKRHVARELGGRIQVETFHGFQNLFFAVTGKEVNVTKEEIQEYIDKYKNLVK